MLHRITGRALKCGPAANSAIAGVPTHEAAAVIRRLFDRPAVNGVYIDELADALEEFGWTPDPGRRFQLSRKGPLWAERPRWGGLELTGIMPMISDKIRHWNSVP